MVVVPSYPSPESPLLQRFAPLLPGFSTELFEAGLAVVPEAAELPQDHFAEHAIPVIVATMTGFMRALDEQRSISAAEVAEIMAPSLQRYAEERTPLRILTSAFFGGVRRMWTMALEVAEPEDLPELAALSNALLDLMFGLTQAMSETYLDVEQSLSGTERQSRRALCAALLRGGEVTELAAHAEVALAPEYDLLAIRVRSVSPIEPLADHAVARRRLRLVQQALDELAGSTALHTFDGASGVALLPVRVDGDARFERLAAALTHSLGVDVLIVAWPQVMRTALPESARQAVELAELAVLLHRPAGVYQLDDLLLEFQLTRPGPARDRLAERIVPLLEHPHLLESLYAHIKFGVDRKAAAAAVHVHPNTFSYRLRRVAEVTGIDPADPNGSRLLAAALTVYQLYPPESTRETDPATERIVSRD